MTERSRLPSQICEGKQSSSIQESGVAELDRLLNLSDPRNNTPHNRNLLFDNRNYSGSWNRIDNAESGGAAKSSPLLKALMGNRAEPSVPKGANSE